MLLWALGVPGCPGAGTGRHLSALGCVQRIWKCVAKQRWGADGAQSWHPRWEKKRLRRVDRPDLQRGKAAARRSSLLPVGNDFEEFVEDGYLSVTRRPGPLYRAGSW